MLVKKAIVEKRIDLLQHLNKVVKSKGLTAHELEIKTGITKNTIERILAGKYSPEFDIIILLAEAIGVTITFN